MTHALNIATPRGPWRVSDGVAALRARSALPGAFGYDLAIESFRAAISRGVRRHELLPAALPVSWMVNAKATSRVFRRWLEPPLRHTWNSLFGALPEEPHAWVGLAPESRAAIEGYVDALCVDGHGIAAISKVLSALAPDVVPLLDDAAIALVRGTVAAPSTADAPTAPVCEFLPMLDWFNASVVEHTAVLESLARSFDDVDGRDGVRWTPSQVLDRVLWYESWGKRHARTS